jgi:hypothetical protein
VAVRRCSEDPLADQKSRKARILRISILTIDKPLQETLRRTRTSTRVQLPPACPHFLTASSSVIEFCCCRIKRYLSLSRPSPLPLPTRRSLPGRTSLDIVCSYLAAATAINQSINHTARSAWAHRLAFAHLPRKAQGKLLRQPELPDCHCPSSPIVPAPTKQSKPTRPELKLPTRPGRFKFRPFRRQAKQSQSIQKPERTRTILGSIYNRIRYL